MYAMNRQEMAETIDYGLVPAANGMVYPTIVEGRETEPAAVRYEFDPKKAVQMLDGLGLSKGSDGFYRDPTGQPMRMEIRATNGEINPKTMFAVADYLQRVGLAIDTVVIPLQLVNDQEYRAKFPGLIVNGGGGGAAELEAVHSRNIRTAETNYSGANRAGYRDAEMDSLIDRYTTSIPMPQRMELARQITKNATENLPVLPLFFDAWPGAAAARMINAAAAGDTTQTWNTQDWDVRT